MLLNIFAIIAKDLCKKSGLAGNAIKLSIRQHYRTGGNHKNGCRFLRLESSVLTIRYAEPQPPPKNRILG